MVPRPSEPPVDGNAFAKVVFGFIVFFFCLSLWSQTFGKSTPSPTAAASAKPTPASGTPFRLIAGSGHATFEPILKRWAADNHVDLQITYKGSLDIMLMLQSGNFPYDAIWEADSLWTTLSGDRDIKSTRSIMCSPIVFGVKKSIAEKLGWVGKADVRMQDLLAAAEGRKLRILMTSATQSNSGASAYFGFLYAFAGQPDVLTTEHLNDPAIIAKTKSLLASINRTSESSGWLRDLFVADYAQYDAMFNYESHIIEANQKLVQQGQDPLYIIYPQEGLGIANFPLSFVSKGNADKEPLFNKLSDYLVAAEAQDAIAKKGRRVGPLCDRMDPEAAKAEWGVDPQRTQNVLTYPAPTVIREALTLYQTALRKPSFTIYALDFSGSMAGKGELQVKAAMHTLLDQNEAGRYLLQASPDDITMVMVFNHTIVNAAEITEGWTVAGNDPAAMANLLARIDRQRADGNTNIWLPTARALELFNQRGIGDRIPAIILMTDGQSNQGSIDDVRRAIAATGLNVPTYNITFGDASVEQLKSLAELTKGRVFDGTKDLITAFRNAKGNN